MIYEMKEFVFINDDQLAIRIKIINNVVLFSFNMWFFKFLKGNIFAGNFQFYIGIIQIFFSPN